MFVAFFTKEFVMAEKKEKREALLKFIDKNAFDPILHTSPAKYKEADRKKLEDIQRKTQNEKDQFHKEYKTAEEVKKNYLSDVQSRAAVKVNKELEHLNLPTLPDLKDKFMKLCKDLEV
jgi:hypothetical protein